MLRLKSQSLSILFGTGLVLLLYWLFAPSSDYARHPIYDEKADGAAQIATALAQAKAGHKLVLLQFGANWCVWCHALHAFFDADPPVKAELAQHYVLVLIDTNNGHNAATIQKYGFPTDLGLPVLVVLNADDHSLAVQSNDQLVNPDSGNYESAKVLAFLKKWDAGL